LEFKDEVAQAIVAMKNNANFTLLESFVQFGCHQIAQIQADVIVPIPIYWKNQLRRGYNLPNVIAATIAKSLNIPVVNLLSKHRPTQIQHSLKSEQRKKNVANCFKVNKLGLNNKTKILLIDDVATTMSTLNEASRMLKQQKFKSIYCYTIAKTTLSS